MVGLGLFRVPVFGAIQKNEVIEAVERPRGTPWWVREFLLRYKNKKRAKEALARLLLLIE